MDHVGTAKFLERGEKKALRGSERFPDRSGVRAAYPVSFLGCGRQSARRGRRP